MTKLADFSPLVGMATGSGAMGKLMRQGFGGIIPMAIAKDAHSDREKERAATAVVAAEAPPAAGMKCGGKVSKHAKGGAVRGAGCATKGVKKCKMY